MLSDDNREQLTNPSDQVENSTHKSLINEEQDNFDDEDLKVKKFDSVCHSIVKRSKKLFFAVILRLF